MSSSFSGSRNCRGAVYEPTSDRLDIDYVLLVVRGMSEECKVGVRILFINCNLYSDYYKMVNAMLETGDRWQCQMSGMYVYLVSP